MKKTKKKGIICLLIRIYWFSTNLSYWNKRNKICIYFSCEAGYSVGNLSSQISLGTSHSTTRMAPSPNSLISMKRPTSKLVNWLDQGLQPPFPLQRELSQSDSPRLLYSQSWETGVYSPPPAEPIACYLWEKIELSSTLMGQGQEYRWWPSYHVFKN